MDHIADHNGLIEALGGGAAVAEILGEKAVTVRAWKPRNRIPPEYWERILAASAERFIDVSADWLMRTMPARRITPPPPATTTAETNGVAA